MNRRSFLGYAAMTLLAAGKPPPQHHATSYLLCETGALMELEDGSGALLLEMS